MRVHQIFTGNSLRNYNYLIQCDEQLYCLDPWDAEELIPMIEKLSGKMVAIINTHEHWDHTRGNLALVERFGCQVWAHSNGRGKIPGVTRFLKKDEIIELNSSSHFVVMDTPGHTFAHLCLLLVVDQRPYAVFSGDTLFNGGVGNCHNGGDPKVLYETISEQFQDLDDDVLIYPGHEYLGNNCRFTLDREPSNVEAKEMLERWKRADFTKSPLVTNMGDERKINTFLRLNSPEIVKNLKGDTSTEKQVFLRLRELRNNW